jgi:hypothetical protein
MYQGGLWAEYFNNAFLDGVPAISRLDNKVDFDWGLGLITNEVADFVSVRWSGKILAPETESFTFILHADDGVRMYINEELVIDRWDKCCEDVATTFPMVKGNFIDVRIEYKEYQEEAYIRLYWTSQKIPKEIISPVYLYYPMRVGASPYNVVINKGPSIASNTIAFGEGLQKATSGKIAYFSIQAKNEDDVIIDNKDDQY